MMLVCDIAIQSGVIAEGTIKSVLDGKAYNRAVRFHKLMYAIDFRGFSGITV